jgi:hypothetical protein
VLNVNQVAKRYDKSHYQVTYAITLGLIKARKWGGIWVIEESDLPELWPSRKAGRPKKES